MSWTESKSRQRVRNFLQRVPDIKGQLPTYSGGGLAARQRTLFEQSGLSKSTGPLSQLSPATAIVVDAVHVYVQLLGFDEALLDLERETVASHRRALVLLHFYYSLLDRLVFEGSGLRVDFHAARMHFIVAEPAGAFAIERVEKALAIVDALNEAAATLPAQLGLSMRKTALRIGIDQGPCIAIANDSGHDLDTVFLGTPANLAAKLAAGDEPGIFASPSVRGLLGLAPLFSLDEAKRAPLSALTLGRVRKNAGLLVERAAREFTESAQAFAPPNFVFRATELPLSNLKFRDLSPSRTVRMEMAAIFADLDAFTAYVDRALRAGTGREVVRTMFVTREEQRSVLKEDFEGKRLRFVGDCVIGLISSGEGTSISPAKTVEDAVSCAAALHSSLEICRQEVSGAEPLGLQVGVAFGVSPLTRLGLRGDMSVRCAASRSIMGAERAQGQARRGETVVDPSALDVSSRVSKLADSRGAISASFAAVDALLSGKPLNLGGSTRPSGGATSASPAPSSGFRAHGDRR